MMDTNDAVLSVEDFSQTVFKAVTESRKHVDSLPVSGSDFECWTSYDEFTHLTNHHSKRILNLIQLILSKHNLKTDISSELLDVEERFDLLTDACDQLMDRIGTNLDDASNPKKAASLIVSSRLNNLSLTSSVPTSSSSSSMLMSSSPVAEKPHNAFFNKTSVSNYTLMTSKVVTRSQDKFKDKIDNSNSPFVPKITEKPNAMIPLGESLKLEASTEDIDDFNLEYPHPYQYELDLFRPAQQLLEKVTAQVPKGVETTPFTYVDTEEKFDELIEKLKSVTEIAVDLEHHSFRSFQGFTCLMQLSTRDEDIVVDTLALRHCIHKINCVFTNPNIIKVLHGADMDVVWLQKDFGVYLVGMFDTGQAARILGLPYFSFAYALQHYCNVKADKQYQLADWRIRPLPAELIKYAREDTHYLLYIYDCMRNDLLHKSNYTDVLLTSAFANSNNLCKKKYQKPRTTETSHRDMYMALKARSSSTKHHLNDRQMEALKQLFAWRDKIARLEDESTGFILPNQMMFQLAEHLPREPEGILACCKPLPTFVKKELADIHRILRNVLELPDSYFLTSMTAMDSSTLDDTNASKRTFGPNKMDHPNNYNLFITKYESKILNGLYADDEEEELEECDDDDNNNNNNNNNKNNNIDGGQMIELPMKNIVTSQTEKNQSAFFDVICLNNGMPQKAKSNKVMKVEMIRSKIFSPYAPYLPEYLVDKKALASFTKWKLLPHPSQQVTQEEKQKPVSKIELEEDDDSEDEIVYTVRDKIHSENNKLTGDIVEGRSHDNSNKRKKSKDNKSSMEKTTSSTTSASTATSTAATTTNNNSNNNSFSKYSTSNKYNTNNNSISNNSSSSRSSIKQFDALDDTPYFQSEKVRRPHGSHSHHKSFSYRNPPPKNSATHSGSSSSGKVVGTPTSKISWPGKK